MPYEVITAERVEVGVFFGHLHADLVEPLDHIGGFARAVLDVFEHGLGRIELGFLLEVTDSNVFARPGFASEVLVDPRHDLDQGRLARAVGTNDSYNFV